jgi:hypothetical protein
MLGILLFFGVGVKRRVIIRIVIRGGMLCAEL